ncbi:MAG: hypothetical protein JSR58_05945 [Verrucomicrobia bacterium]|nr:hypothetical protein [Verrucomicrobiota bacterium]
MSITSADLMSVGKIAFTVVAGAGIAFGANAIGKMAGKWIYDQSKKLGNPIDIQNPEVIGGVAGGIIAASVLKLNNSLMAAMLVASVFLTTLAAKKIELCALKNFNIEQMVEHAAPIFFSGLIALAGARFISPEWGALLGMGAAIYFSQEKTAKTD